MAQKIDLYSILVSYANKNNSPYVDIDAFLEFLGRYAKKHSEENPEWHKWVNERAVRFWAEMSTLVEENKCEILSDTDNGSIYMPYFYLELIEKSYLRAEQDAYLPFPCEESLKITLPVNQTKLLSSEYDITTYMEQPQASDIPVIKINFHEECGTALVLASMIPRRLMEAAILKLRYYLRKGGNTEYALRKLSPQLHGKESYIREQINQIQMRPLECVNSIQGGGEFTSLFWAHFCILIKNDIRKKNERLSEDIAAFQSVVIIEAISEHYKNLAVKKREAELAFKSLENHLTKPPYLFPLEKIIKFTNAKGVLLLSQYTEDELGVWLKEKTTESKDNKLPVLLVIQGSDGNRYYLLKDKMLALCSRLLAEGRPKVKDEITKNWRKLLLGFGREPAMESDEEYEKVLSKVTEKLCPILSSILEDPKLLLVNEEMEQSQGGIPLSIKIFNKGMILPYSSLFFITRKEILTDAKLVLPFWYSLPIITPIIAFFKKISAKRKAPKLYTTVKAESDGGNQDDNDRSNQIRAFAEELQQTLVPPGFTMESYLEELESRWSRLIDKKARENLIEDVKSLIRDNLRQNLKLQKHYKMSKELIHQMAVNLVTRTTTLATLSGRESLILYSELYLLKLLQNIR